jgi:hypothetical protein
VLVIEVYLFRTFHHTHHTSSHYASHWQVVSGDHQSHVCVWEVDSGRMRFRFGGDQEKITAMAFDKAGRRLLTGSVSGVRSPHALRTDANRTQLHHITPTAPLTLTLTPTLFTGSVFGVRALALSTLTSTAPSMHHAVSKLLVTPSASPSASPSQAR